MHTCLSVNLVLPRFAFPLPKNGEFREILNYAIKKVVESGEMHKLRAKWATAGKNRCKERQVLNMLLQIKCVRKGRGECWGLRTPCQHSSYWWGVGVSAWVCWPVR